MAYYGMGGYKVSRQMQTGFSSIGYVVDNKHRRFTVVKAHVSPYSCRAGEVLSFDAKML